MQTENKFKVLFVDTTHPRLLELLREAGFDCDYQVNLTRSQIIKILPDYHGVILRSKIKIDKELLDACEKLEFIGRVGAGLENIDVAYAKSLGIRCFNSPEGNRDAVGEHALGMLLCLLNKINIADSQIRQGIWSREPNRGVEIKGKTVGIIGYGNTGRAFARRLSGFFCNVIAYDKYKEFFSDDYVVEVTLKELHAKADIVSIHVPLTDETKYMIDDAFINKFRKNIYLINTARGKVVKTTDLVKNLQKGKVIGAALDVLEYEDTSFEKLKHTQLPEAYHYLMNAQQVIMTPHIAGWTAESNIKLSEILANKIIAAFSNIAGD